MKNIIGNIIVILLFAFTSNNVFSQTLNITYFINGYNYFEAFNHYSNLAKSNPKLIIADKFGFHHDPEIILPDYLNIDQFESYLNRMLKRCGKCIKQNYIESKYSIKIFFSGDPIWVFHNANAEVFYLVDVEIFDKNENISFAKLKYSPGLYAIGLWIGHPDIPGSPSIEQIYSMGGRIRPQPIVTKPGTLIHIEYPFRDSYIPPDPKPIRETITRDYQQAGKTVGKFICKKIKA